MEELLSILRCPYSGTPLRLEGDELEGGSGRYKVVDGVPSLVDEERVAPIDHFFQQQYGEDTAEKYDRLLRLQGLLVGSWEPAERRRLAALLDAPRGGRILEVSVGTGSNLPYLDQRVGPGATIVGLDLSLPMIRVAQRRTSSLTSAVYFVRGDACSLPFADDAFDAVFHFGGLNMFGDVAGALREMVRVAKPGAPIVAGDEGMSERRRRTWLGRQVAKMNSLNLCRPPLAEVPWELIEGFELHWLWRELFYVMRFRKAAAPDAAAGPGVSATAGASAAPGACGAPGVSAAPGVPAAPGDAAAPGVSAAPGAAAAQGREDEGSQDSVRREIARRVRR